MAGGGRPPCGEKGVEREGNAWLRTSEASLAIQALSSDALRKGNAYGCTSDIVGVALARDGDALLALQV